MHDAIRQLKGLGGQELLAAVFARFKGQVAVTSSFGAESAVLLDLVARVDPSVPVIFLDTGALFDETLAYRDRLEKALGLTDIRVVRPEAKDLAQAEDLWRSDVDQCCELRKVRPLALAVADFLVLIDGRKRAHGFEREGLAAVEATGGKIKVSPLAEWSTEDIERHFVAGDLPRHPLVAQGYRSIGCWPCTRPTQAGESPRSGRWAGRAKSECGIHITTF